MNPKISDFRLAKTFVGDQTEGNTNRVAGTNGYMAPEYATDGLFSAKSDVYSFGIIMLEIISVKKSRGFFHPDRSLNLIGYVSVKNQSSSPFHYANSRNLVGPIPLDDGVGKEITTQITTAMKTARTFYIDSNGRDFIKRIRDFRTDWDLEVNQPVAGNYYPVNLGIYLQDDRTELSILVDHSVGGSSLVDGQIELILHRRLIHDDVRGVGEVLN